MTFIPDKLYFKIGEVAKITDVKPYVLRYWESEFKIISPKKSQGNQRMYRKKDVELIVFIRDLLYKEKFTLEGAKKRIVEHKKKLDHDESQMTLPFKDKNFIAALKSIKTELEEIRENLN